MTWKGWLAVATVIGCFAAAARLRRSPAVVLLAGVAVLVIAGVLKPARAAGAFANEGLATIAVLYIVAGALRETGAIERIGMWLLGVRAGPRAALARLIAPVMALSAFVNNTPLVAALLPVLRDWARRFGIAPSKMLIPLSYAAILGGMCTIIGTSTNMIVSGMWSESGRPPMGVFWITPIGLPCAVAGALLLWLIAPRVLPERRPVADPARNPREYAIEMLVESGSPIVGRTLEEAGLRHLENLYVAEIERAGRILPAVGSQERLEAGDRLVFVGVVDAVAELRRFHGLRPATDQVFRLDGPASERMLVEAVVSPDCPLVGRSIREGRFRAVYGAAVLAVARRGERIRAKIGDIVLEPGDTLLLEAGPGFLERHRWSRDFYLATAVPDSTPPRRERAVLMLAVVLAMLVAAGTGFCSLFQAAVAAAAVAVVSGAISTAAAWRALDTRVLLALGAGVALSRALEDTGAASVLAERVIGAAGSDPWRALVAVYIATAVLTELVTNAAAAAVVFPLAMEIAQRLGADAEPFAAAVMIAASTSFLTPLGYQTNLMVYGAGGYRFGDFARAGLPVFTAVGIVALLRLRVLLLA